MQELRSLHNGVYALHYHMVLVTKDRRKMLTRPMLDRVGSLARERCVAWGGSLLEAVGGPDYVRLLVELPPTVALANFVNALKTNTSRLLRKEFRHREPALWDRSYYVVTSAGAPPEALLRYVRGPDAPP